MINIDQLYDIASSSNASKSPFFSNEEYESYKEIIKCIAPLEKENSALYHDIHNKFIAFSELERHSAFKHGFRTAMELIMSSLK